MLRRFLIPLVGAGLLLGVTAGSALGKCEADPQPTFCSEVVVSVSLAGGGMAQAGTVETLLLDVSQGERPFAAATSVVVTLVDAAGTSVRSPATVTSPGLWTAEVKLPSAGSWSVMAEVVGQTGDEYRIPVYSEWGEAFPVLPAEEQAPTAAPPVTPAAPVSPVLPIALLLGLVTAAAVGGLTMRDRARRRTAGARVSAADRA
jgi:hypothetical protein